MDRYVLPSGDSTGSQDRGNNRSDRPAVVIFQLDGGQDSYVYDLPSLMITNSRFRRLEQRSLAAGRSNQVPTASTTSTTSTASTSSTSASELASTPASTLASTSLASSTEPSNVGSNLPQPGDVDPLLPLPNPDSNTRSQRNMSVSVSYVYSQSSNTEASEETRRTGTIMLNVPNVPLNRTETQMNNMIELAVSIALGAIAAFTQRRQHQISRKTFDKFPVLDVTKLSGENSCPICYDEYLPLETPSKKRSRDEEEDDQNPSKKSKTESKVKASEAASSSSSSTEVHSEATTDSTLPFDTPYHSQLRQQLHDLIGGEQRTQDATTTTTDRKNEEEQEEYTHVPVKLPCGHIFGRSCSYEWLKGKNTCPLCRAVIHEELTNQNVPETMNLPNINSFLNASSADGPMVVVLDRTTNTLLTRQRDRDAATATSSASSSSTAAATATTTDETAFENISPLTGFVNDILEPMGIPSTRTPNSNSTRPTTQRDPDTLNALNDLNLPMTEGFFPTGVVSRRTRNGVETFNLGNRSRTMGFATEARRILERRLELSGRNDALGFNDQGEVIRLPPNDDSLIETNNASSREDDGSTQNDESHATEDDQEANTSA